MSHPDTDPIRRRLLAIRGNGSFAAAHTTGAIGLELGIEGVGSFRLPPSPAELRRICDAAVPSPFGHLDETRHDDDVRRALEIPADRIHLDPDTWGVRLQRATEELRSRLGLTDDLELEPRLHKLVLYEEGGFFVPHRDTEVERTLWASLVVVLPSAHQGGALVVRHAGETVTFDTASDVAERQLSFVAFYPDCLHEVRPVTSGCRVALTFGLHAKAGRRAPPSSPPPADLAAALGRYFAEAPQLVVLLDHAYTTQRLDRSVLKGLDAGRVDALCRAADEPDLDLACFFALASVREWFQYGDSDHNVESREGFGARKGASLTLSDWRDLAGVPVVGDGDAVEDACIVATLPPLQREVQEIRAQPWTGNEGGTAEQWYRQAALVLVRRGGALYDEVSAPVRTGPSRRRVLRRRGGGPKAAGGG